MKKMIYVVEDDLDIGGLVDYLLTGMGFSVHLSITLAGLTKQLKETLPDLILLDIMLPDGSGTDMCRQLKSAETTHAIPVLLMSAHAEGYSLSKAAAADAFISKPFDIDHLTQVVEQHLP
jgi:two-component system phosphate regulon response regulator PhoB